jgi:hypothetical protein
MIDFGEGNRSQCENEHNADLLAQAVHVADPSLP